MTEAPIVYWLPAPRAMLVEVTSDGTCVNCYSGMVWCDAESELPSDAIRLSPTPPAAEPKWCSYCGNQWCDDCAPSMLFAGASVADELAAAVPPSEPAELVSRASETASRAVEPPDWLATEAKRAKKRSEQLPPHARPLVTRPIPAAPGVAPTAADFERGICSCGNRFDGDNLCMESACEQEGVAAPSEVQATPNLGDDWKPYVDDRVQQLITRTGTVVATGAIHTRVRLPLGGLEWWNTKELRPAPTGTTEGEA